jgi:hypothetical protein
VLLAESQPSAAPGEIARERGVDERYGTAGWRLEDVETQVGTIPMPASARSRSITVRVDVV